MIKQKHLLCILTLGLFSVRCSAQMMDTTCHKARWIAVKKSEHNSKLFDSTLVLKLYELVKDGKFDIYSESRKPKDKGQWYPIPEMEVSYYYNSQDTVDVWYDYNYLEIRKYSDIPLANMWGEDSILIEPDGTMVFVYPPPTVYPISIDKIVEFRIKEERVFDKEKDSWVFKPTGLSICRTDRDVGTELFWINLYEFLNAINEKEKYVWYDFIINREYLGFQYMQTSCYDEILRY